MVSLTMAKAGTEESFGPGLNKTSKKSHPKLTKLAKNRPNESPNYDILPKLAQTEAN